MRPCRRRSEFVEWAERSPCRTAAIPDFITVIPLPLKRDYSAGSSGDGNSHPLAILSDFAARTKRADRFAEILPVRHKQIVDSHPILRRKLSAQSHFRLFRRLRPDITKPVRNAMYMGIHRDAGLPETKGKDDIRSLSSDTGQLQKI